MRSSAVFRHSVLEANMTWSARQPWVWGFPWGFPWLWVWDEYGDCDESPLACGDSTEIFEWT